MSKTTADRSEDPTSVPAEGSVDDMVVTQLLLHDARPSWSDGTSAGTFGVEPGDIVCTRAGTEHDVVAVRGTLEAFWFEASTPPGGRIGHLHRTPRLAQGHDVPPIADDAVG